MKKSLIIHIICCLYAALFIYAALNKLFEYDKFTIQIGQSPLLTGFGDWLPWMVIGSELVLAVMLLIERFRKIALYGSFSLMVMFTIYIAAILNLGSFIPCSCGGVLEKLGWTEHLIFNGVFVLLGLVAIILYRDESRPELTTPKTKAISLSGSLASSIAVMAGLIFFSGVLKDKHNSFLRLFPSHPVVEGQIYNLKYNSYYLAGGTSHSIYLANYVSPLSVLILNTIESDTQRVNLDVEGIMDQKFWSVRIEVDSPYYYVYDGAVPRIYRGNVNHWHATQFTHDKEYFLDLVPISSRSFFIKSLDGKTSESMLGKISIDSPYYRFDNTILEKQVDGFFCTDGTMLYNQYLDELIYLYRYRNEYIVMDTSLQKLSNGYTIDTISHAKIKVGTFDGNTRKMAAPPLTVNKRAATYRNWLFVQSSLLAKNEHPKAKEKTSVIDVYDLTNHSYLFSFYIYHFKGEEKLRQFKIYDGYLVALFNTHIQLYELSDRFFPI